MAEERYRLYVDESGDHVFYDERSLQEIPKRYLALVGCFFKNDAYLAFHEAIEKFKEHYFPRHPDEPPVIFHRTDIIKARKSFWRLRDDATRKQFDDDLLRIISDADFRIVAVVVDKLALKTVYPDPWHPYHASLGFMLQRYCGYLNHFNRSGDVYAESRGKVEDGFLSNAYEHVFVHGDRFYPSEFYRRALTREELILKKKEENIAGLQLADIIAHPVKQEMLSEKGILPAQMGSFVSRLKAMLLSKYNRHLSKGHVEGYGKVWFPELK
ncbi:MAG: DUF3800 domain-containing protein [Acidobacteriota bacterium]|nr:MAG: DUF3800 domain-containing protein [Acidobacteriota bacterium]